jgi:hypothetical protein
MIWGLLDRGRVWYDAAMVAMQQQADVRVAKDQYLCRHHKNSTWLKGKQRSQRWGHFVIQWGYGGVIVRSNSSESWGSVRNGKEFSFALHTACTIKKTLANSLAS